MEKLIKVWKGIMTAVGVVGLTGFIASVLIQVVARTFLPTAPNWTEEAARFLFIYMVAFAGNAAVLSDEYVGVELLTESLPKNIQRIIKMMIYVIMIIFSGFVFSKCVMSSTGLIAITPPGMVSTALELPMKYVYCAEVVLFGGYIISYILRIYMEISQKKEA